MVQHNPDCKPPVCSWRPWPQISSAGALAHARRLAQLVPRTVAARVLPAVPVLKAYTVLIRRSSHAVGRWNGRRGCQYCAAPRSGGGAGGRTANEKCGPAQRAK